MGKTELKPELMSPAGHWPQLKAAIEAGADAVYFGLNHFSARAKVGFEIAELPQIMKTLHRRAVKGFVTFNTLVFEHEIEEAKRVIREIELAGVDAIIVQDIGVAQLVTELAPDLDIHGSTQMSITSAQGAEFAESLGCSRVVLGRELSLPDIRKISEQTDVELEVFVHGALCVSYSGQCFSSEAWGGRSANRGQCAQACRLSYDLIVDGQHRDLEEFRYLLSPGDLYAIEQIPELVDIGVSCLKIEGRYKDPEYVAITTRAYRKAIDSAWECKANSITSDEFHQIEQSYSRGLGPHFISGTNHQSVVNGRAPRHRGVKVGVVTHVDRDSVIVKIEHEIRQGDGLVFDAANHRHPDEPEEGGFVYQVASDKRDGVRIHFGKASIDFDRIRIGDWVWKTHDPQLARTVKHITNAKEGVAVFTRPLDFHVTAKPGKPLLIKAESDDGITAEFVGAEPLVAAKNCAFNEELLQEQLGRLGGSPFHPGGLSLDCVDSLFVSKSELNHARRALVNEILKIRETKPVARTHRVDVAARCSSSEPGLSHCDPAAATPQIHVLVRSADQLDAAINSQPNSIALDYLELYGLRPAVDAIKAANISARVASPRILKPAEQNIIRFLTSLDCEVLVRSAGLLNDLLELPDENRPRCSGDFSLNAANSLTLEIFRQQGLTRVTPTHDLNAQQIADLAGSVPPGFIEVIAFQHLPVFHTEHCVFCRYLSEGTDHTNCGHPCEKHRVALRDGHGRSHPVMADVGCRNTVFGAQAQSAAKYLPLFRAANLYHFRLEFVHETAEQVSNVIAAFKDYFTGQLSPQMLEQTLSEISPADTTSGSLFVPKDFKQLHQIM